MSEDNTALRASITITSQIIDYHNLPQEPLFLSVEGNFRRKGKAYQVEYDESPLTGMEGTHTLITCNDRTMTLRRSGACESYMSFTQGKRTTSYYNTPEGNMVVAVLPDKVDIALGDLGGKIRLRYSTEMNQQFTGTNTIQIGIQPII